MTALLEVTDVSVQYRHVNAVRDVSLHVAEGEIVTVLGLNGAGKSSLLGAIAGRVPKRSGTVVFDGENLTRRSMARIVVCDGWKKVGEAVARHSLPPPVETGRALRRGQRRAEACGRRVPKCGIPNGLSKG